MPNKKITNPYQQIVDFVRASRLKEALDISYSLCKTPADFSEVEKLRQTYRYMSEYMLAGIPDQHRNRLYASIKEDIYALCDRLRRERIAVDNSALYYSTLRFHTLQDNSLDNALNRYLDTFAKFTLCKESMGSEAEATLQCLKEKEEALDSVFDIIWTAGPLNNSQTTRLSSILDSGENSFELKAQILSALTLSLLQFYDRAKLMLLIDVAENTFSSKLAARALPGVIFVLRKYAGRLASDLTLAQRLMLWNDSLIMFCRLRSLVKALLRTRDTDRVADKMRQELIPEIMKLSPEIMRRMRDFSAEADVSQFEENPEWHDALSKSGLTRQLEELSEMQSEGADVMMVAFSNLKGFPFFRKVSHWLLPFTVDNPVTAPVMNSLPEIMRLTLLSQKMICNSDKFSFVLSLQQMPEAQKSAIFSQLGSQFEQIKDQIDENAAPFVSDADFDSELSVFLRDMYRLYKLFPRHKEFYDPFASPLSFLQLPFIGELLKNDEIVELTAEFYFAHGYYKEALQYLLTLYDTDPKRTAVLEKIAFCYQSLSQLDNALMWYERALLMNGESLWLLKKLAHCYKALGDFEKAANYYSRALERQPDDMTLLLNTGHALYETGKLDEALKLYYKALYLHPDSLNPLRAIAWCEMALGKFDKALPHFDRLLAAKPKDSDFVNAAHLHILMDQYAVARQLYSKALQLRNNDLDTLRADIETDLQQLPVLAGKTDELHIMLDSFVNSSETNS
ncbi:MAG: tetratricopeptide repeat protein [Muribaculaceae bacterium]|nr:tetratricopeptide repeat protein [Muribaculaceae bacterium]